MRFLMAVKMQVHDLGSRILVRQYPLCPVAERDDPQSVAARRHLSGHFFQIEIRNTLACKLLPYPTVLYAGAVDAQQKADARLPGSVIDVSKTVDAVLRVENQLIGHAINDTRSAACCRYFPRAQGIEGKGVIGLVAGSVGHGNTGRQPEFCSGGRPEFTVKPESRGNLREQVFRKTEVLHQVPGGLVFLKIP